MADWTDEMRAIAAGMKRAGLSNKAIAARLGVKVAALAHQMRRVGARRDLEGRRGPIPRGGRLQLDRCQPLFEDLDARNHEQETDQ